MSDTRDVLADYVQVIEESIAAHPRSLQKRIGPSEIGIDCERRLIHKIAGDDEPADSRIPWKPALGTAMHSQLEEWFNADNQHYDPVIRWICEDRVDVGELGDTHITGSTDLFDTFTGTVLDHKIVGNSTLSKYRTHGPSRQYRTQAHLYGRGWARRGYPVQAVAICFLPREAEWSKRFLWTEPYDEQVALDALGRLNMLAQLIQVVGKDAALTAYDPCDNPFCPWCKTEQRNRGTKTQRIDRALA
ncbi:hypothetical protein [Pseudoclavibacter sp. CFCC 11306]|uniref:hypothetical protein n=1 Tax=Pseudoclavibacter sp. CFCC 11306 TaxID=1564493 RepID=UPI001300EBB0|nr:hypothetical protein [Pseudoclavibacter sp. CFCC 11306]KAB1658988.1 hypothetical protein F8O09_05325 [Pseudoclavibacter sp. CFCC 11306]